MQIVTFFVGLIILTLLLYALWRVLSLFRMPEEIRTIILILVLIGVAVFLATWYKVFP